MPYDLIPNISFVRDQFAADERNSKVLTLAVGQFVEATENLIASNQKGFLYTLMATGISLDDFPDETTGLEQMAFVTADLILKKLDYADFNKSNTNTIPQDNLNSMFVYYYTVILDEVAALIQHSDENLSIVEKYIDVLRRKEITSISKNQWGDIDETQWEETLTQFAIDKIYGSSFMSIAGKSPLPITSHAAVKDIDKISRRFVSITYKELIKKLPKLELETMTGEDFELKIKHLLETKIDRITIETTPRTGDNGADLIAHANNITIAIQAKYYTGSVGNSAIQEIYSAKDLYRADFAVVVTNSYYTRAAQEVAKELGVILATEDNIGRIVEYLIE